jgi:hypothetical protein
MRGAKALPIASRAAQRLTQTEIATGSTFARRRRLPPSLYLRSHKPESSAFSPIDHAISHRPDSVVYVFVHFGLWNCEPETNWGARSLDVPDPKAWIQSASTPATVGQALGPSIPLAHRERPPRTQPLAAKRRMHAAKRERPGREARAFTLNRRARQFRARPSVSRGLRPLIGSRESWTGFERFEGSSSQKRAG